MVIFLLRAFPGFCAGALACVLLSPPARADAGASPARPEGAAVEPVPTPDAAPVSVPGFYRLDAGAWSFEPRGAARFSGTGVDFQRDLDLRAGRRGVYRVEWAENLADTARPWYLPVQLSADYVGSTFTGQQVILPSTILAIGPIVILQTAGTQVNTDTRFSDAGAQLGWKLWRFLPGARLEGGVVLKRVDADINVVSPGQTQAARQTANALFPLPVLAVTAGRGPVRLRAETAYGRIARREAFNAEALVNWQPRGLGPLGFQAGWRYRRYRFDTDNGSGDAFDLRLSGWRLGARLELGPTPNP